MDLFLLTSTQTLENVQSKSLKRRISNEALVHTVHKRTMPGSKYVFKKHEKLTFKNEEVYLDLYILSNQKF